VRSGSSPRAKVIKVGVYIILTVGFGFGAFWLFNVSAPQQPRGNDATPDMLLLTSERTVGAYVRINYFQWYNSTPESLSFGASSGSFPTGAREIQVQFSGGKPSTALQYAILLGRNGSESNPVGQQNQKIFNGSPGGISSSNCVSPQTSGVVQVLYGQVRLNAQGSASINTVGRLMNQHPYLENGSNDVVGVIDVNTPISALAPSTPGSSCIFPDWPYLGGTAWYSPGNLNGEVTIGSVGNDFSVTSSDPPLVDLATLSWQINGATSISYTLTNNAVAHRQLLESFSAGVVAALAAALALEAIKTATGTSDASGETPTEPDATLKKPRLETDFAGRHPIIVGAMTIAVFVAAIRSRRNV
jgi:hypothetical protein